MAHLFTQYGPGDPETWGPVTGHPNDPRWDEDDEFHNEQTALDAATDDVLATPYTWAWFLNETVDGVNPVPTHKRFDDMTELSNGELLALVMDCFDRDTVMLARAELRDRFLAHADTQQSLLDRAAELVGEPR